MRFVHSHSGTSSTQLAIWAAKDLNLFAKYRLDVDLVFIAGAAGGSAVRLAAMEKKALDATALPYDQALMATRAGMRVLADIPTLVPNFPDKVITMRRSFVQKERETA